MAATPDPRADDLDTGFIDTTAAPSGPGCAECLATDGWWVHLRRCAACGHIGCCDSSPHQHATAHFRDTGHRYMTSYEPGESWWWDYTTEAAFEGPELAPPTHYPPEQGWPAPRDRVPANWQQLIH
ncbi:UBP-type zinc finger domain-containing protein [Propionibacteriaceae bacterium G1746]|uniref:UBP-type zinc finger domain-containing protein n=1 Tax=Aestuariimicrobium sp. G57 TaxID=3418485 RepID=UPI003C1754DC